jgi:hypothetical protein
VHTFCGWPWGWKIEQSRLYIRGPTVQEKKTIWGPSFLKCFFFQCSGTLKIGKTLECRSFYDYCIVKDGKTFSFVVYKFKTPVVFLIRQSNTSIQLSGTMFYDIPNCTGMLSRLLEIADTWVQESVQMEQLESKDLKIVNSDEYYLLPVCLLFYQAMFNSFQVSNNVQLQMDDIWRS